MLEKSGSVRYWSRLHAYRFDSAAFPRRTRQAHTSFLQHRVRRNPPLTIRAKLRMTLQVGSILTVSNVWKWVLGLGGPGLIVVGLIDNSVVPIPGGMDVCVILLTSHHREWWVYYGAMATVGAVIGGYVTFRLAKKGGKASLE